MGLVMRETSLGLNECNISNAPRKRKGCGYVLKKHNKIPSERLKTCIMQYKTHNDTYEYMRKYMYMNMTNIAPFKTIWDTLNYNKTFSLLFNQKSACKQC